MNSPKRVLVVDDEPLARKGLIRLLGDHQDFQVKGECGNGRDALVALESGTFDLVLLDVEMPEMNGFDVLAQLDPARMPAVIFVTAFDHYAVGAFEAHALDYLLKPVAPKRFAKALRRVGQGPGQLSKLLDEITGATHRPERLAAKTGGRTALVPVDEIDWIQAADNYVRLHVGGRIVLHREPLGRLVERLDPKRFQRVHRSHAVNLDRIREVRCLGRGDSELRLVDGTRLAVSRRCRDALARAIEPNRRS